MGRHRLVQCIGAYVLMADKLTDLVTWAFL
jgi:hypothetical protein